MINHFFSAVGGNLDDSSIHTNGVLRASLYTKAAKNADAEVDIKTDGIFLDVGIWMLAGHDVDATGWASCFTHHAGNTTGTPIFALG